MSANPEHQKIAKKLASQYTPSMKQILDQLGISLLVTTYQAGKLITIRSEGNQINTRFSDFQQPMGLAFNNGKFALGTHSSIHFFHNVPSNAPKLSDQHFTYDACYLHKSTQITGNIDIHEMGYDKDDELWFINTKFSCLCTNTNNDSFIPRWRPPFITSYDNLDRCHLNGLGFKNGKPQYVTALGTSNEPLGWRKNKAFGGMLMDIETNEMLADGLSMPHSPRVYNGKLWFLESGRGSLSCYSFLDKKVIQVASLPGFTRGIDFCGNLAFIGLSKVRESATFGGIPLTQQQHERICGVWVINIDDGNILGCLQFTEGVQEIFAVSILPHKFPEVLPLDHPFLQTTYVIPQEALNLYKPPETPFEIAAPYFEKGNDLYTANDLKGAIDYYQRALKAQPDHLPSRFNLGVCLHDLNILDDAEKTLKTVLADEAQYFEAYYMLGSLYEKRNNPKKAHDYYNKSLAINPDFTKAIDALSKLNTTNVN